jgi:hypothetical protein
MTLSLCEVCHTSFAEPPILNTEKPHHERPDDFVKAATNCYICRAITKSDLWREVQRRIEINPEALPSTWYLMRSQYEDSGNPVMYTLFIEYS